MPRLFPATSKLADSRPSRAVSRDRGSGAWRAFVVRLDGLDDEIEFIGAVDFPGHALILAWRDDLGFGEVVQPIDPSCRVISHDEHNTGTALRPREQEQMIGAEVEHRGKEPESGSRSAPAPMGSADEGLPGGLLRSRDIATARRLTVASRSYSAGGFGFLLALRRLSPPSRRSLSSRPGDRRWR